METFKKFFYKQTIQGEKTTIGEISLIPEAQVFIMRWRHGGVVWNRPLALLVERDGQMERIRIMNLTHRIQLGLLGFSLIFCIIIVLIQYGVLSIAERKLK